MLKHAMPPDLIQKFDLKRLPPMTDLSPEEQERYEDIEAYSFPMPDRQVNCWFQIFSHNREITNPNMLIFSAGAPDPACMSVPIAELWNRTLEEMQRYIAIECKKFQHEEIKKAQMN
jgi:hypothetical protein